MKTRIAAAVAAVAFALGLVAAVTLGLGYAAITSPADDSDSSLVAVTQPAQPATDETSEALSESEIATLATMQQFIDDCMADAGFAEYEVVAVWDPEYAADAEPWDSALTEEQSAAADLAMWGDAGTGADYRWEDAGCAGYGTHMIGADNDN